MAKETWSSGEANAGAFQSEGSADEARNFHSTVKPIDLMRWLCRLVTPPGGTVLDNFAGSGTTGCAAVLEGFDFVGIERELAYVPILEARVRFWAAQPQGSDVDDAIAAARARRAVADAGQAALDLFGTGM